MIKQVSPRHHMNWYEINQNSGDSCSRKNQRRCDTPHALLKHASALFFNRCNQSYLITSSRDCNQRIKHDQKDGNKNNNFQCTTSPTKNKYHIISCTSSLLLLSHDGQTCRIRVHHVRKDRVTLPHTLYFQ